MSNNDPFLNAQRPVNIHADNHVFLIIIKRENDSVYIKSNILTIIR